jgi:hypothetical protein
MDSHRFRNRGGALRSLIEVLLGIFARRRRWLISHSTTFFF